MKSAVSQYSKPGRVSTTHDKQVVGKDHGLGKVEYERLVQSHGGDILESHVALLDFSLRLEVLVTSDISQTLSSPVQDVLGRSLGHGEGQEKESTSTQPEELPELPPPSLVLSCETGDDRSQSGSGGSEQSPNTQSESPRLGVVHVLQGSSSRSERWRTEESGQETQDQESGKVVDERGRYLKGDKDDQGDDVRWVTSDGGNLGQGGED
jgi:hypothetical protein